MRYFGQGPWFLIIDRLFIELLRLSIVFFLKIILKK